MVWRQLPKLIPAGSIPVSRSKQKEQALRLFFLLYRGDPFRGFGRYPSLRSKDKGASRTLSELNQAKAKRTRSEAGISPHLHR